MEQRVIYIDVGNMPPSEARAMLGMGDKEPTKWKQIVEFFALVGAFGGFQ